MLGLEQILLQFAQQKIPQKYEGLYEFFLLNLQCNRIRIISVYIIGELDKEPIYNIPPKVTQENVQNLIWEHMPPQFQSNPPPPTQTQNPMCRRRGGGAGDNPNVT